MNEDERMTGRRSEPTVAVDAFSGAGGASCGLRDAGYDVVALERWEDAADTHDANHDRPVLRVDLKCFDWAELLAVIGTEAFLMWASPPCQPFSSAGDQEGEFDERDGIPWWLEGLRVLRPAVAIMENVKGLTFEKHAGYLSRVLADVRALGYEAQWRVLDCADYGVPQNRERFVLIARRDGVTITWPATTHVEGASMFHLPWVTMAEAVPRLARMQQQQQRGEGMIERHGDRPWRDGASDPSYAITGGAQRRIKLRTGANSAKVSPGRRGDDWRADHEPYERDIDRPAPTVDTKGNSWTLHTHRGQCEDGTTQTRDPHSAPAPALTAKAGGQWTLERPSTTVACDPRVMAPGHHDPRVSGSQMADSIRLETHELAALQAFPADYVWHGTKTSKCTQIGNAVPPPLAHALAVVNRPVAHG